MVKTYRFPTELLLALKCSEGCHSVLGSKSQLLVV